MLLALVPAVSGFIGTTQIGWQIGAGAPVKLTTESALLIAVLYYLAMLVAVASVGWAIHWMSRTYGSEQSFSELVELCSPTACVAGNGVGPDWP